MIKKFFYWINERHQIYLKKEAKNEPPWTKDKILQEYKFTNVFRNLDRVIKDLHRWVVSDKDLDEVSGLRHIILFRMFNVTDTYLSLCGGNGPVSGGKFHLARVKRFLHKRKESGKQIFTGAYIITNNGSTRPKIDLVTEAVDVMWKAAPKIVKDLKQINTLQGAVKYMTQFPMVGQFIAYELVCDFRWTSILGNATDIWTWANPGPGAKRGLNRIHGRDLKYSQKDVDFNDEMHELLSISVDYLGNHVPLLEMRDIEHSLCEFDKYMRVKNGEGRPRSKYRGGKK
jgi:hypothetical protein